MALSKLAQQHADEIANHDWSDAPYRIDRAGHRRSDDRDRATGQLTAHQTEFVKTNAMWVTAQVLAYNDPNFDVYEFAAACGINTRTRSGHVDGGIAEGLRKSTGQYCIPGTWETDPLTAGQQEQLLTARTRAISEAVQTWQKEQAV